MNTDLWQSAPQELAESANLDELLNAVWGIEQWQDWHGQMLDYIYRHRLLRLVRTRASLDEVRALYDHLARINHSRRRDALNALDRPYADRWQAYRDLLDTHIAALRSHAPERLLQRTHVAEILERIRDGRAATQQDIQEQLSLGEANASRILKLMEAAELVVRHRVGRENHLLPGPSVERIAPPKPKIPRGSSYLTLVA